MSASLVTFAPGKASGPVTTPAMAREFQMRRARRKAAVKTSRSRGSRSQFGDMMGRMAVSLLAMVTLPREKGAVRPGRMAA